MKINLCDNKLHLSFAPLTLTKPIAELRVGILTNVERYKLFFPNCSFGFTTEPFLQKKYPKLDTDLIVNANVIPSEELCVAIHNLQADEALFQQEELVAYRGAGKHKISLVGTPLIVITNRWDLFLKNDEILKSDFLLLTKNRKSQKLSKSNLLIGKESDLFIEEGAKIEGATLNTTTGPIYVGKNAEIMEGSLLRGALSLGENSVVKMGSKIYGACTIGPGCKVGGELNNVLFQSNSNKAHDGFLGNSIIGSWCNLGADSNCSNLKNNYSTVSSYNFNSKKEEKSPLQFMGISMGDYSKCGINTMFNTGSVIGVSSNIFGAGFPPKYISSFKWGGNQQEQYDFEKAIESINRMMARRNQRLSKEETELLEHIQKHFSE